MFGALGSISDQNFYMGIQNVPSLAGFLIFSFTIAAQRIFTTFYHSHMYKYSGGLRTRTPLSEHNFSCCFIHHISRKLYAMDKKLPAP